MFLPFPLPSSVLGRAWGDWCFKCLVEFTCEAIWSWAFFVGRFLMGDSFSLVISLFILFISYFLVDCVFIGIIPFCVGYLIWWHDCLQYSFIIVPISCVKSVGISLLSFLFLVESFFHSLTICFILLIFADHQLLEFPSWRSG